MMGPKSSVACLLVLLCHVTGSDVAERAADPVAQLKTVTDRLTQQVTQLTAQYNALKADLAQKVKQLTALDTYCKTHVTDLSSHITRIDSKVAFTVRFNNDSVLDRVAQVGNYQYLKFDIVQYETGGSNYNKTTGLFTAPVPGVYAFYLTVQRIDPTLNKCLDATIMKNTNGWLATVYACPPGYTVSSNMATVLLRAGDKVHVQTRDSAQIFGYVHTTFTGLKL